MNSTNRLLPNEILLVICQYLSHSELQECIYVCKAWNRIVTPEYFRELTLTRKKLIKWSQSSLLDYSTENEEWSLPVTFPSNASHVTYLKVYLDNNTCPEIIRNLYTIFCNMPNIEKIEPVLYGGRIDESHFVIHSFLEKLYNISVQRACNNYNPMEHLKNIVLPNYLYRLPPDTLQLYHTICSQNASSMTHLHLQSSFLTDKTRKITYETGEYSTVQDFLGKFSNLTHLEINYYNGSREIQTEEVFSRSIFVTCPRLVDLKIIKNTKSFIGTRNEKSLLRLLNGTSKSSNLESCGSSTFCLETYAENAENLYNFIKCHKQLKVLNLKIEQFALGEWWYKSTTHDDINSDTGMRHFMNLLKSIPSISFKIGSLAIDGQMFQGSRINRYYYLLNVFLGALSNKKRLCKLDVDLDISNTPGLLIQDNKSGQLHISFKCSFDSGFKNFFSDFLLNIGVDRLYLTLEEQENCENLSKISSLKLFNFLSSPYYTRTMSNILIEAIAKLPNLAKIMISPKTTDDQSSQIYELTSSNSPSYNVAKETNIKTITVTPLTTKLYKFIHKANYLPSPAFVTAISSLQIVYLEVIGPIFRQIQTRRNTEVDFRNPFPYLEHLVLDLTYIESYYDHSEKEMYCNQFIQLEYSNPKQPQDGISKSCYYKFDLKKKQPVKNWLMATVCSENEMSIARSSYKFKLATIKVNDRLKTVEISSKNIHV